MAQSDSSASDRSDEALVRQYLTAWSNGRVLDALNTLSMDAMMRDPAGHERRGIREVARAFAGREHETRVEIEDVHTEGDVIAVRLRMTSSENRVPRDYRSVFCVSQNRIQSLMIDLVPAERPRKGLLTRSA